MTSCFNTFAFKNLAVIKNVDEQIGSIVLLDFPLHHIKGKFGPKDQHYDFYWTPICLSGPRSFKELENCVNYFERSPKFGGAYIQTRFDYIETKKLSYLGERLYISNRTVFYLPTKKTENEWFLCMKKDSRTRFMKIKKELDENKLRYRNYNFSDEVNVSIIECCYKIYSELANKNNFREQYRFTFEQLSALIQSEKWCLHTISVQEDIVGFSVLGDTGADIDYTFAATLASPFDVSRALILSAFRFGKLLQKSVCLGGGISENDKLAMFKQRMGTEVLKFVNLKICGKALYIEGEKNFFKNYKNRKWPDV